MLLILDGLFVPNHINLTVTKTVRELLFEGYEDLILDLVNKINDSTLPTIPFDKFGWFYAVSYIT